MIASCTGADDRELVEAVRSGDDSAFEELYRRYHPRIAAYVRRIVRDPARAEDLAQDAFFSALRRMRATDADIAFKPWIFEIARNATIDHWRRAGRAQELSVDADDQLRPSDRGRRRLESEYADISEGRRCAAMRTVMARLAEGLEDKRDRGRLARHAR